MCPSYPHPSNPKYARLYLLSHYISQRVISNRIKCNGPSVLLDSTSILILFENHMPSQQRCANIFKLFVIHILWSIPNKQSFVTFYIDRNASNRQCQTETGNVQLTMHFLNTTIVQNFISGHSSCVYTNNNLKSQSYQHPVHVILGALL